ncbi:MAG: hydroxyacid dehydrogenase [Variovorax sp.]|nr:hydroxyacid dehydrogenase [Variovorax sp.]
MPKQLVLQHGRLSPSVEARLIEEFDIVRSGEQTDSMAIIRQHADAITAMATSARHGVTAEVIEALPRLRAIASFGVGYDNLDVAFARGRDIAVSYTPDVLNDCVADLAWGAMLDLSRGLSEADRFMRRGDWPKGAFRLTNRVSAKKLGIVGLGRIGRAIAQRASGFTMDVRYHNRRPVSDVSYVHESDLAALAHWADYLVVAVAGGSDTRHLVSKSVIEALGPKGYLINIARGSSVDEDALTKALQAKSIAGAALDVYSTEPCFPEVLAQLDNVLLLPHIGTATHETRAAMGELVIDNLKSFFETGHLLTPVPVA